MSARVLIAWAVSVSALVFVFIMELSSHLIPHLASFLLKYLNFPSFHTRYLHPPRESKRHGGRLNAIFTPWESLKP
jgi:hypothetical protein